MNTAPLKKTKPVGATVSTLKVRQLKAKDIDPVTKRALAAMKRLSEK